MGGGGEERQLIGNLQPGGRGSGIKVNVWTR